jgi:signal transduction histidine kinase
MRWLNGCLNRLRRLPVFDLAAPARVWLLVAAIAVGAFVLALPLQGLPAPVTSVAIPFWALVAGFYAAERAVVHLHFRHHAHSFSMSEIPLVVGLVFFPPLAVIAAQLIGVGIALTVHRKQSVVRVGFNLGQFAAQTAVAALVFHGALVLGADPLGPTGWAALVLGTFMALILADLLINTAIRLSGGSLAPDEILRAVAFGAAASVANVALGIVMVIVLVASPTALILAAAIPVAAFLAYRAFVEQGKKRERLSWLYEATRLLHGSPQIDVALERVLYHARTMLQADHAAVVLVTSTPGTMLRTVVGPNGLGDSMSEIAVAEDSVAAIPSDPAHLKESRIGAFLNLDAPGIAAPLIADGRTIGAMVVAAPMSDVTAFGDDDLALLEALAQQVSVSVENSRLEESLHDLTLLKSELEENKDQLEDLVDDLDRRLSLENALLSCSQTMLNGQEDEALDVALAALLEATSADYAYVAENYDDSRRGLCHRLVHDAGSQGSSSGKRDEPRNGAYSDHPALLTGLRRGGPVYVRTSDLPDDERSRYEAAGIRSELRIPFFADGRWTGTVGFVDYARERNWETEAIAALRTAADMIGAFWQRRRTMEQLRALIRSKDEFVASVSHEVRTPLTAVVGLAEELRVNRSDFSSMETDEFIGLIADQSREVANIIEDLLVAARADTGTLDISLGVVDLRDLVGIELVGGGFTDSLQQGSLAIEMLEAPAWGDPTRVRQIVRNLLTNALRYGGDRVRVFSGVSGDVARVGVADNGSGVPAADRDRIFEPYQRAHDRPTQPGSVGLGLTVARQLAGLMGGDLTYRYEGGESIFELSLPAAEPRGDVTPIPAAIKVAV